MTPQKFPPRSGTSLSKSLRDMHSIARETKQNHADMSLKGLRPGMAVAVRGNPGVFMIIDVDPAAARVRVRQAADMANCPDGVNFVEPITWVSVDALDRMPDFDTPGAETTDFARILDAATRARATEAGIADIQARGRRLVATKRAEISEAIRAGKIDSMAVAKLEAGLNGFCVRLGI